MSASDKQINYIQYLCRELNLDRDYNFRTMTGEQAEQIINEIKDSPEYEWAFGEDK